MHKKVKRKISQRKSLKHAIFTSVDQTIDIDPYYMILMHNMSWHIANPNEIFSNEWIMVVRLWARMDPGHRNHQYAPYPLLRNVLNLHHLPHHLSYRLVTLPTTYCTLTHHLWCFFFPHQQVLSSWHINIPRHHLVWISL